MKFFSSLILVSLFSLILSACSSGSSSGSGSTSASFTVSGAGVKGPLAFATVRLYRVDYSASDLKGTLVDEGETNASAAITGLSVPAGLSGRVILDFVVDGDTVEVNTGAAPVFDQLTTIVDVQRLYDGEAVYASPLTTMVFDLASANADKPTPFSGNNDGNISEAEFTNALEVARRLVTSSLGFGMSESVDIFSIPPLVTENTTTINDLAEVIVYRQAIEAVSALTLLLRDDSSATDEPQDILNALIADLSDGVIDGNDRDGSVNGFATLTQAINVQLNNLDESTLLVPGTTDPISDIERVLADETDETGVSTNTDRLVDGSLDINPSDPVLAPVLTSSCSSCDTYQRILDEAELDIPVEMIEQPDGKIVVLSEIDTGINNNGAVLLSRLNTDGSLDSSFGTGGHATHNYALSNYVPYGMAMQGDGKILVVGSSGASRTIAISRFNSDGSLDTNFASSGTYAYYDESGWAAREIAVDSSGNIIVSASLGSPNRTLLIRLTTAGVLDTSFDTDGLATFSNIFTFDIHVLDSGDVLLAGNDNSDVAVVRVQSDGSLDTDFGSAGLLSIAVSALNDTASVVKPLANGDVLIAGTMLSSLGNSSMFAMRISETGVQDMDFGVSGIASFAFTGSDNSLYGAMEQSDGKIIAVGFTGTVGDQTHIAFARLNADGSLDDSLPGNNAMANGLVSYNLDYEAAYNVAQSVLRRSDGGYLILAGTSIEQVYYTPTAIHVDVGDVYLIGLDENGALDNNTFITTGLANEVITDADNDGIRDRLDVDDDDDGVIDESDNHPLDTDNDGINNDVDTDDDGDGILDGDDTYPYDLDNDGILNGLDPDDDGDGRADENDAFPHDASEQDDTDGDGIGNNTDPSPYPTLTFALSGDQTIGLSSTLDNAATPSVGTHNIQYSSSNTNIATVDASGTVTAVAVGTATISADLTDWPDTPATYELTVNLSCGSCTSSTATIDAFNADFTSGVIELADGDLLVFGYEDETSITSAIARLNFDGTLDSSFNSGSILQFTYAANMDTRVVDAVEQADGKILLLSEYAPGVGVKDFLVTRLEADGSIDTSYGTSGHFILHEAGEQFVPGKMVLQSDNYLVVVGTYKPGGLSEAVVIRLNDDGDLDSGFGYLGTGMRLASSDGELYDVTLDGNNIVAVGTNTDASSALLMRLTSAGDLDTTFNTTGIVSIGFAGEGVRANNVILQTTGQYVISGHLEDGEIFISRYNTNGSLDTLFGASGISREGVSSAPTSPLNESYALLEQSDGTLLVAGGADLNTSSLLDTLVLWRFDSDGVIDSVVTSSLGFTLPYISGVDLVNSISGGVVIAVDNYQSLSGASDMVLFGINNDGTEDTDRFQ